MADNVASVIEFIVILIVVCTFSGYILWGYLENKFGQKKKETDEEKPQQDRILVPNHLGKFKNPNSQANNEIVQNNNFAQNSSETNVNVSDKKEMKHFHTNERAKDISFIGFSRLPHSLLPFSFRRDHILQPSFNFNNGGETPNAEEGFDHAADGHIFDQDDQEFISQSQLFKQINNNSKVQFVKNKQAVATIRKVIEDNSKDNDKSASKIRKQWEELIRTEQTEKENAASTKKPAFGLNINKSTNSLSRQNATNQ